MIRFRDYASRTLLGALVATPFLGTAVDAGDYVYGTPVNRIADRCAQYGDGYVDIGSGTCGRVNGHVRVYGGARNAAMDAWASNGTSTAAMRSSTMVPGPTTAQHLRVRGSLDSYSPFR